VFTKCFSEHTRRSKYDHAVLIKLLNRATPVKYTSVVPCWFASSYTMNVEVRHVPCNASLYGQCMAEDVDFAWPLSQVSNARLSPADFTVLAGCTTLEHLFLRFTYQPDTAGSASTSSGPMTARGPNPAWEFIKPRELHPSLRLAARGSHAMVTRSRKSLQGAGGRSSAGSAAAPAPPPDCTSHVAPYVLRPLLHLRKLRSLELTEERQPVASLPPRLSAVGVGAFLSTTSETAYAGPILRRRRGGTAGDTTTGAVASSAPAEAASLFGVSQPQSQELLPLDRSGLNHFLFYLPLLDHISAVSIQLLTEEEDMPDCPCRTPCFAAGMKGKDPPLTLDTEVIQAKFTAMEKECYKFVLGSLTVESSNWYRPSTWPSLGD
jgi:hypothetical protein